MYGTQARNEYGDKSDRFENDVKMYGTQACFTVSVGVAQFENDVKMYGTQASPMDDGKIFSLRMM